MLLEAIRLREPPSLRAVLCQGVRASQPPGSWLYFRGA
jgi:hypothetical protein